MINPHITPAPRDRLPDAFAETVLDQSREHHQILGAAEQLVAHFAAGAAVEGALGEDLALVADAGDGPEEERADVAGDGGGEGVEGLRAGSDGWDGGFGVQGEEVEGVDDLFGGGGGWG